MEWKKYKKGYGLFVTKEVPNPYGWTQTVFRTSRVAFIRKHHVKKTGARWNNDRRCVWHVFVGEKYVSTTNTHDEARAVAVAVYRMGV